MNRQQYLVQLLRNSVLLISLLPCLALAQALPNGVGFEDIPMAAYGVTIATALMGCIAGTLHRMSTLLEDRKVGDAPDAPPPALRYPKVFISSNILGGLMAGWLSFLTLTHAKTPSLLVQCGVLISAFAGAVAIERLAAKLYPNVKSQ